ncbi:hypothetical protein DLAC_11093 [Tieghemostelium lacteum]|uniref:F-box domain-containing protein n=1 Tax=Tieghemostelium lacteum TaxID=361077 RepID=A0A151Z372_TIELA|nr:hypothetical protein DLAC_11093 [Tieghemostelium lacteum]|eukprot:KYQ88395.1 hypothetical protein DLAC_11093 [Tieghemostelium lacteum]
MHIPNYLIIKILENIVNISFDIEYLSALIANICSVSKAWNRDIIPKLECKKSLFNISITNKITKKQLERIVKSDIKFSLKFTDNVKNCCDLLDIVRDHVTIFNIVANTPLSNELVQNFKNLEIIELNLLDFNSGYDTLDQSYLKSKNISLAINNHIVTYNDRMKVNDDLLKLDTLSYLHIIDMPTDFQVFKSSPSMTSLIKLKLMVRSLPIVEDFFLLLDNLQILEVLNIELEYINANVKSCDPIIERFSGTKIKDTLKIFSIHYKSGYVSYGRVIKFLETMSQLEQASFVTPVIVVEKTLEAFTRAASGKALKQLEMNFHVTLNESLEEIDYNLFDAISQLQLNSFFTCSKFLEIFNADTLQYPLFQNLKTINVLVIMNNHPESGVKYKEFVRLLLSSNLKNLKDFSIQVQDKPFTPTTILEISDFVDGLIVNTHLESINFYSLGIEDVLVLLKLSIPFIRHIKVQILDMSNSHDTNYTDMVTNMISLLSSNTTLETFFIKFSVSTSKELAKHENIVYFCDILSMNHTLKHLCLPFGPKKKPTEEQLERFEKVLQSNNQILKLYAVQRSVQKICSRFLIKFSE